MWRKILQIFGPSKRVSKDLHIAVYSPGVSASPSFALLESGDFILLETGDKIIL